MPIPMLFALLQDPSAEGAADKVTEDPPNTMWMFLALGLIFYFLLIRPQGKERKKRAAMLAELGKGDKVMTSSGMHGTIKQISDETVTLQVADGVNIKFSRQAIQGRVDDPTAEVAAK